MTERSRRMDKEVINLESDEEGVPGIPAAVSGSPSDAGPNNGERGAVAGAHPAPGDDNSSVSSADSIWDKSGLPPKTAQKKAATGSAPKRKKCDVPVDEDTEDEDEELEVVECGAPARGMSGPLKSGAPEAEAQKQPPAPTVDAYLGTWKVMLLMDVREFGQHKGSDFLQKTEARINKYFGGVACELLTLPSADYMFVARLISHDSGEVIDERVLDFIIERKHVNDLQLCLIKDSKKHRPLSFFEAQMYKMQNCGINKKLFLMEGDEDDPSVFSMISTNSGYGRNAAPKLEQMKRLKRVKTIRLQIAAGEWQGVDVISTRTREDTVQYLILQLERMKQTFDPLRPPTMTMDDVKAKINEEMSAPTFREYLRQISQKGIGPVKAMKVIKDEKLGWDKSFQAPSCVLRKVKSTLEDHATFWGESQADVAARNLANARSRKIRSQQSGGVYADIDELDKNVDACCALCRKEVDVFEDGIVSCNRVAKCGKTFHQSCLSAQGYDISASDGCVVCRGLSKFNGKGRAFSGKGQTLGGKKPSNGKKPSAASKAQKASQTALAAGSVRDARLKRFDSSAGGSTASEGSAKKKATPKSKKDAKQPTQEVLDAASAGKKRKWKPAPEKIYINKRPKLDHKPVAAAKTTVIDRNGFASNPLHDAHKYAATAMLLDKADSGDLSSGSGGAQKWKGSNSANGKGNSLDRRNSSISNTAEEEDTVACGICDEAIDIWVEQDIVPCNRVSLCGAAFHQGCLAACEYDLQAHDGCIKCEDKALFSTAPGEARTNGNGKPAAKADADDVIVVDSDDEDNDDVIVID